jgi:hypothetical protein
MTADGASIPIGTFIQAWQFTASKEYDIIVYMKVSAEQTNETLAR